MSAHFRVQPLGDTAFCVEMGDEITPDVNARVRALDRALAARPFPGFVEAVPTHRSLLVIHDPDRLGAAEAIALLEELVASPEPMAEEARLHLIEAHYGGDDGPDLGEVARRCGRSETDVAARHQQHEYRASMLGFMPGFAYLGPLPSELHVPRRATPRPRVPAGSVAMAGGQTGIYPAAVPGGWSLIGRSAIRLFDPFADPPVLIRPGDRVRFVGVDRVADVESGRHAEPTTPGTNAIIDVLSAGLVTTVQDGGRIGFRRYGVSGAGAMDAVSLAAANRAVGNPDGDAALECTLVGPTLRFLAPVRFAVAGADLGAMLERADLRELWPIPLGVAVQARAGNVLRFAGRQSGCRAYVALEGGLDEPLVLGSRATDLGSGFGGHGGRRLARNDRLSVRPSEYGPAVRPAPGSGPSAIPSFSDETLVRVVAGPQADLFTEDAWAQLLGQTFTLHEASDRVGCRLAGPAIAHRGATEVVSDGMVPGCIQVPPDGQPIVMMADGPTTGGYPKIATVVRGDLRLLAQLVPGSGRVRFKRLGP